MKWTPGERDNIDDRRGGGMRMAGAAPMGLGGVVLLLLLSWATGTNLFSLIDSGEPPTAGSSSGTSEPLRSTPQEEHLVDFVNAVAGDVQATWTRLLRGRYEPVKVVLFRDATNTACGVGESASGPFYCPGDRLVYLDLAFFEELSRRFGAPGDFAQAYVIAHEYGHHVQNLLGISDQVGNDRHGARSASVALELQADCFAGVWGHDASESGRAARGRVELDPGDAEEALRAAAAIGDDRLQRLATGRVQPERFTHGSSAQRVEWFRRGFESGDVDRCDTFGTLAAPRRPVRR